MIPIHIGFAKITGNFWGCLYWTHVIKDESMFRAESSSKPNIADRHGTAPKNSSLAGSLFVLSREEAAFLDKPLQTGMTDQSMCMKGVRLSRDLASHAGGPTQCVNAPGTNPQS